MDAQARENYLQTQVMTATPQKLQLMLLEGAIRFANQVVAHWEQGNDEQAMEAMSRCRRIISEVLGGIKNEGTELSKKISGLYLYVFRTLTEAQLEKSNEKVQDVIRVLDVERETWKKVCDELGTVAQNASTQVDTQANSGSFDSTDNTTTVSSPNIAPALGLPAETASSQLPESPSSGISFEA